MVRKNDFLPIYPGAKSPFLGPKIFKQFFWLHLVSGIMRVSLNVSISIWWEMNFYDKNTC
jgi:hypothetical protein